MKLRLLLWLMASMYRRAITNNPAMRDYLQEVDKTIQFATDSQKVARYLRFADQKLASEAKIDQQADLTVSFSDAKTGFAILWAMATGKDKNAFMRGIQEKQLTVAGDPMLLMWFQKSVKYLR